MRPDVMEGVPEEPGIYLIREEGQWRASKVTFTYSGLAAHYFTDEGATIELLDHSFDNYTWSERIQPPEEGLA